MKNGELPILEIKNGSIFCSCRKADFVKALIEFSKKPIDYLFVENSGLSDPAGIKNLLEGIFNFTESTYIYKGCVCLVDATTFTEYHDMFGAIGSQISESGLIVVNKTDLADEKRVEEVHRLIGEMNNRAFVYDTTMGRVPEEIISNELVDGGEASMRGNIRPAVFLEAYSFECGEVCKEEDVIAFLDCIKDNAYRVKGFFRTEQGALAVNGTRGRADIVRDTPSHIRNTQFVVFERKREESVYEIIRCWSELVKTEINLIEKNARC